jgi:DNA-binding transcriptional MerR regulator
VIRFRRTPGAAAQNSPMAAAVPPTARSKGPAAESGRAGRERETRTYSISDLAQEFALTTRAIRFYEGEGLLKPERRGQTRIYGDRERTRIKLILRGKRLGLALSEIRELFDIYAATGNERAQLEKFLPMLSERRAMLLQQREDIDAVLAEIGHLERECRRRLKPGRGGAATGEPLGARAPVAGRD